VEEETRHGDVSSVVIRSVGERLKFKEGRDLSVSQGKKKKKGVRNCMG